MVDAPAKEQSFFDGIDITLPGLFKALKKPAPAGADAALAGIDARGEEGGRRVLGGRPFGGGAGARRRTQARRATRIGSLAAEPDAVFVLKVKEQQFQDAINAALGLDFAATAQPAGLPEPTGMFAMFAPPPAMPAPVPGQTFEVRTKLTNRGKVDITPTEIALETDKGWTVPERAGRVAGAQGQRLGDAALQRDAWPPTSRSAAGRISRASRFARIATRC